MGVSRIYKIYKMGVVTYEDISIRIEDSHKSYSSFVYPKYYTIYRYNINLFNVFNAYSGPHSKTDLFNLKSAVLF